MEAMNDEKTLHARPPILSPGVFQAVAQYAEVRWPTSATYKRKGTVRANVMRVSKQAGFRAFFVHFRSRDFNNCGDY